MTQKISGEFVTILSTSNSAIMTVAKSLLDEAHISYILKSSEEENGSLDNNKPIDIQVNQEEAIIAKRLLADLEDINFEE
jgi:hypothetical protein